VETFDEFRVLSLQSLQQLIRLHLYGNMVCHTLSRRGGKDEAFTGTEVIPFDRLVLLSNVFISCAVEHLIIKSPLPKGEHERYRTDTFMQLSRKSGL